MSPSDIDPAAFAVFAQRMRTRESGDQPGPKDDLVVYSTKNRFGFLGAYQFGMARLCDFGLTRRSDGVARDDYRNRSFEWCAGWTEDLFLRDHQFQDRLFERHCAEHLHWIIKKGFDRAAGEMTSALLEGRLEPSADSVVSMSGMLAVCHLVGRGGLSALVKYATDRTDGNDTPASHYMQHFGGIF